MMALTAGIGLLVAAAAVHYFDVIDLTGVFIQLISYLTPDVLPDHDRARLLRWLIKHESAVVLPSVFQCFGVRGRDSPARGCSPICDLSAVVALLSACGVLAQLEVAGGAAMSRPPIEVHERFPRVPAVAIAPGRRRSSRSRS